MAEHPASEPTPAAPDAAPRILGARVSAKPAARTVRAVETDGLSGCPREGQHRIAQPGALLEGGVLREPGYAFEPLLRYARKDVGAAKWRIKEWDYYLVQDARMAFAVTVSDLGYLGLLSVSLLDFDKGLYITESSIVPLTLGSFRMPETSDEGVIECGDDRVQIRISTRDGVRELKVAYRSFADGKTLSAAVTLDRPSRDSMVIATPWANSKRAFYYNRKIVGMRARGTVQLGSEIHGFSPDDALGLLDWGRGVWTYDNTWFWGAAQGYVADAAGALHVFGMNIGYGFGDTSAASENMLFLDGRATKLGRLDFGIPVADGNYDLMSAWHMRDDAGMLDLVFTPDIDRADYTHVGPILTDQHQVFGLYDGRVTVEGEDGSPVALEVHALRGFAEVVHNKY